jgi:hypothetical protein
VGTFSAAAVVALAALLLTPAVAAEVPNAVSPGGAARMASIGNPCPTFSWTEVPAAEHYELVVYSVGEAEGESTQLRRHRLPGGARSWTPSLDSCLDRGGRYAWSVRAAKKEGVSEWSAPSLFEVTAESSEAELEGALEVIRQYLEGASAGVSMKEGRVASGEAQRTSEGSLGPQEAGNPAPLASVAGDSALQVNGAAVVTTPTLGAGLCLAVDYRYVDLGDGTVLDCNTEKIWLKDAACLGTGTWGTSSEGGTVQKNVADLNGGTEWGCKDYIAGTYTDWEVPAMADLCGLWDGSCTGTSCCTASQGIVDTSFSSPAVTNAAGDGPWMEEDAFVRPLFAWALNFANGNVYERVNGNTYYVMPVRSGQ